MSIATSIQKILDHEVYFRFSKSWGAGGQNINKRETKAELYFNIQTTQYLTPAQQKRLIALAGNMVHHGENILIMTCQEERLQKANKEKVIAHFTQLVSAAMVEPKKRIATLVPKAQRESRILDKKYIGKIKSLRKPPQREE